MCLIWMIFFQWSSRSPLRPLQWLLHQPWYSALNIFWGPCSTKVFWIPTRLTLQLSLSLSAMSSSTALPNPPSRTCSSTVTRAFVFSRHFKYQGIIQGFDKPGIDNSAGNSKIFKFNRAALAWPLLPYGRLQGSKGHFRPLKVLLCQCSTGLGSTQDPRSTPFSLAPGISKGNGTFMVNGGFQHPGKFVFILWCHDGHVGDVSQDSCIVETDRGGSGRLRPQFRPCQGQ